jgi:hypothetical protein
VGEVAVSTGESDGVAENSAGDGESWAETSTIHDRFSLLGLKTNIEFEIINVTIEFISSFIDFWVGVPFLERCVGLETKILKGSGAQALLS